MKIQWPKLLVAVAIPLAVGGLAALLTRGGIQTFQSLRQPPLSPPGWLFPLVWTLLYTLMGIASYCVATAPAEAPAIRRALTLYALQLLLNFFWPIFFFGQGLYFFSFLWLVLLWVFILLTIRAFRPLSPTAAYLMLPYLLWVTFAGYLNFAIALLN